MNGDWEEILSCWPHIASMFNFRKSEHFVRQTLNRNFPFYMMFFSFGLGCLVLTVNQIICNLKTREKLLLFFTKKILFHLKIKYMYMLKMHIYADVYIDMSVSMWSKSGRILPTVTTLFTILTFMCDGSFMCVGGGANFHLMVNRDFFFYLKHNQGGIMSNIFFWFSMYFNQY